MDIQPQRTVEEGELGGLEGKEVMEGEAGYGDHEEEARGEEDSSRQQEAECFAGTSIRAEHWKTFKIEEGEEVSAASLQAEDFAMTEEASGEERDEGDYMGTLKSQAMTEASAAQSLSLWHSLTPMVKDRSSKALLHRRCRYPAAREFGESATDEAAGRGMEMCTAKPATCPPTPSIALASSRP
eukprot:48499-Hanusia_phi.AAC.1